MKGGVTAGTHGLHGLEAPAAAGCTQFQPPGRHEWVGQPLNADAAIQRDYLQAGAAIVRHVEAVVGHFAGDGLTHGDYFKALAAEPLLLQQEPATIIGNIEMVMDRYAADQPMRNMYLQAAVRQPILFRTPPETVFAAIEAAADRLEAEGVTSSAICSHAGEPHVLNREPVAIRARPNAEKHQDVPISEPAKSSTRPTSQTAASSPLPSTFVDNPAYSVSCVAARGHAR
jgi:hypothetical protein